jgi:cell division protein FtsW
MSTAPSPGLSHRQVLVGCVAILMLVSLVMIYSNTAVSRGTHPLRNRPVVKQTIWVALSAVMLALFAHLDYRRIARMSVVLMPLTLLTLAGVFVFGSRVNGALRWYRFGPVSIQPSEFAKIAVVLYLADFVRRKREVLGDLRQGFLPPLVVIAVVSGLILVQPDFGTAFLIGLVAITMLICAGVRMKHVVPLAGIVAPVAFLLIRMKEYRWRRLIVFLNPWADPQGDGYHVVQSLIALGCGGWTGVGPGRGMQKLGFLPEAETDFIFAVYGQESGFIGCLFLLGVFTVLVYAGLRIARNARDTAGALISLGVTVLIGYQMLINVAVATSAMPTKGISLPLVSYGGSSLLAFAIGLGLMLNVARQSRPEEPLVRGAMPKRAVSSGGTHPTACSRGPAVFVAYG